MFLVVYDLREVTQGALSPTKSTRHPYNSNSPQPDLADSRVYLGPLYDQYFMINDLLPALQAGRGGARSRSTSYYTSVVTNDNHNAVDLPVGAMSARGTKPYRSIQHMLVCDSDSAS